MKKVGIHKFQKLDPDFFSGIDISFAEFIQRLSGKENFLLRVTLAFLSRETAAGHICLDLSAYAEKQLTDNDHSFIFPEFNKWQNALTDVPAVGKPGEFKPVILDETGRLYLYRYWQYERDLARELSLRAKAQNSFQDKSFIRKKIKRFFPDTNDPQPNMQKAAALIALLKNISIICGGPGTGKTTTVAKILALLLECSQKELKIALSAPTGKAADRLQKALADSKPDLPCKNETLALLPENTSTLHRLLGFIPNSTSFRHNKDNFLPYDVIVIDEASMIDLPLLSKTLSAASPEARIILIGDKDQLASVESGAAFGDICTDTAVNYFSTDLTSIVKEIDDTDVFSPNRETAIPALSDCIVELNRNYRFKAESNIFKLGSAVNRGDIKDTLSILKEPKEDILHIKTPFQKHLKTGLARIIEDNFVPFLETVSCKEALSLLGHFRILCALREGPGGTKTINTLIEKQLVKMGLIDPAAAFYHGRPVLITQNNYSLNLYNGDTGIIFSETGEKNDLKAFFPDRDSGIRSFHPAILPAHETVFAMTIHKSQGSEFDHVMLVLPEKKSPVLTRELIYTAITRTKQKLRIFGSEKIISYAVSRNINRESGLKDILNREGKS